jgi:hypothetical protein
VVVRSVHSALVKLCTGVLSVLFREAVDNT